MLRLLMSALLRSLDGRGFLPGPYILQHSQADSPGFSSRRGLVTFASRCYSTQCGSWRSDTADGESSLSPSASDKRPAPSVWQ
mmetsp:Transcript_48707/g.101697  ORF Transcript_48707/g.101697 Transcript_48707/m.101697 type:complete len:83 (+) Transcript_48707:98-346(+)